MLLYLCQSSGMLAFYAEYSVLSQAVFKALRRILLMMFPLATALFSFKTKAPDRWSLMGEHCAAQHSVKRHLIGRVPRTLRPANSG